MRRVVITGMGLVSPIGHDLATVKAALVEGWSGIRAVPEWAPIAGLKTRVAGRVEGIDPQTIARRFRRTMGRVAVLGVFAANNAVADAGLDEATLHSPRTGAAFGSTTGSPEGLATFYGDCIGKGDIRGMEGTLFPRVMSHTVAANVAAVLGVRGRLLAPCVACASSAQAIGEGYEAIRDGHQDVMVCGGAEEMHPSTAAVFDAVYAASRSYNDRPTLTPRPFDRDRDGLVVSEGAAAVVLEELERARARGAPLHGEVLGYATCCDVSHMTQPNAEGMLHCMREAVQAAGLSPGELDYINAHATGTEVGDPAEAKATRELVGDAVPLSSTKGHTGHTLAACGAMEAIFCLLMMRDGFLAPTLHLDHVAEDCRGLAHVRELVRATPRRVLSNSFAFGGVMASLVLGDGR
jgi:3-oxoacyl-[acyl-carrier-protein] synthase II